MPSLLLNMIHQRLKMLRACYGTSSKKTRAMTSCPFSLDILDLSRRNAAKRRRRRLRRPRALSQVLRSILSSLLKHPKRARNICRPILDLRCRNSNIRTLSHAHTPLYRRRTIITKSRASRSRTPLLLRLVGLPSHGPLQSLSHLATNILRRLLNLFTIITNTCLLSERTSSLHLLNYRLPPRRTDGRPTTTSRCLSSNSQWRRALLFACPCSSIINSNRHTNAHNRLSIQSNPNNITSTAPTAPQ